MFATIATKKQLRNFSADRIPNYSQTKNTIISNFKQNKDNSYVINRNIKSSKVPIIF